MAKRKSIPFWLPEDFRVYVMKRGGVINWAAQGTEERILPTVNRYDGADGGYVAFYTLDKANAVYHCVKDIYVLGQVRLKGKYVGRIFHPDGYEGKDISADQWLKDLCWTSPPMAGAGLTVYPARSYSAGDRYASDECRRTRL